jgi:hypothetical protein
VIETIAFIYKDEGVSVKPGASALSTVPSNQLNRVLGGHHHPLLHSHHSHHHHQPENFHPLLGGGAKCVDLNSRNRKGQTAMHIAINKGYVKVVRTLLKLGAQINVQDSEGDTPLHDAITKRFDAIVDTLLEWNANMAIVNKVDFNVIQHAVLMDNTRLVFFLFNFFL